MEILTRVLEGSLEHWDSTGSGGIVTPGEIQRMSAGTGTLHSEFKSSQTAPVRFLQIWIRPERRGMEPGHEQRQFQADSDETDFKIAARQPSENPAV